MGTRVVAFIFIIVFVSFAQCERAGPPGLEAVQTSCEEFSSSARFNPYSVLGESWFIFFYWAPFDANIVYTFSVPTLSQDAYLHHVLDEYVKEPVNWTARRVLMKENTNVTSLLVERGDRGEYWFYMLFRDPKKEDVNEPIDVRFKQTADNKYLAVMFCKYDTVFVMSRKKDVPPKKKLAEVATKFYRGRKGKSYLYQGHEWMPIPEASEAEYWQDDVKYRRRFMYD